MGQISFILLNAFVKRFGCWYLVPTARVIADEVITEAMKWRNGV